MQMQKVRSFMKSAPAKYGTAVGLMAVAGLSQAAAIDIDVADVVATLAGAIITVTAVCTAAISIVVVIKVFKYVRAAF